MTEGEEFLRDYLTKQRITFRDQQIIEGLRNDSVSFRKADFYLPKYNVYVEYFGQWNLENEKERYRIKRNVYLENEVPCIFIYPENLGIIEYIFPKRMIGVCQKYKLEKSLQRYKWKLFIDEKGYRIILLLLSILAVYTSYPWQKETTWLWLGTAGILWQLFYLRKEYQQVFVSNKPFSNYYFDR